MVSGPKVMVEGGVVEVGMVTLEAHRELVHAREEGRVWLGCVSVGSVGSGRCVGTRVRLMICTQLI